MIYRVVIIDNGNQVSLTQQGSATPIMEVSGTMVISDSLREYMEQALDLLKEAIKDDTDDN